jgi:hypothetical protein
MLKSISLFLGLVLAISVAGEAAAQSCPPNSHPSGSSGTTVNCVCNAGYVYSGGSCVRGN